MYDGEGCDNVVENRNPEWLEKRREERPPIAGQFSRQPNERDNRALLADVAFNRHSMNSGHHVSPSDNGMLQVGTDNIRVELVQGIDEDQLKKTLTAATRATIGLDLTQTLPGDWEKCDPTIHAPACMVHVDHKMADDGSYVGLTPMEDWEEMLKGGLQTALETQVIIFAVSGVSRTCTHQLVRSRRAAFHQQSQRAGYMGDMPEFRMPESVYRNERVRREWYQAVMRQWRAYRVACEENISYQDARFILGEGTTNFIMLEYPIREFLNVYAYRGCSMFQWEIVQVMREARRVLVEAHPFMEPYVKISCEKTGPVVLQPTVKQRQDYEPGDTVAHHCTFQGWEDVEGQCDFPWAKQEARTFKPAFHRISKEGQQA